MPEPLRVALLAGGDSAEREISLLSGRQVTAALRAAGHTVETLDPAAADLAATDWRRFDVCFLALHGGSGEDGRVQQWLADRGVPYTGSGPAASRAAMSKSAAKTLFCAADVRTPPSLLVGPSDDPEGLAQAAAEIGFPLVVKPDGQGSSFGLGVAAGADELPARVAEARRYDPVVLVERFIAGREMTVAVLGRQPLPALEIVGHGAVFDYQSKYDSPAIECRPLGDLPPMTNEELQRTAVGAAAALGTAGLVRVDLILDPTGAAWVLEVNTLPGMTDHSLAPQAAALAGMDLPALCDWMLCDALARHNA